MGDEEDRGGRGPEGPSRIPSGSVFYSKVVPFVLVGLGILTAVLILVAAGVLLGILPYR
jgi:hypothetical protein